MAGFFQMRQKKNKELLRDEKKHIKCEYDGDDANCKYRCEDCAIALKTDGDIALSAEIYPAAVEMYKQAIELEPEFAEAWVNLGNAYGYQSDYENALYAFNKAIEQDPIYGKALLGKAITLRNMNRLEDAIKCFDSILELYDHDQTKKMRSEIIEYQAHHEIAKEDSSNQYFKGLIKEISELGVELGYLIHKLPSIPDLRTLDMEYLLLCFNNTRKSPNVKAEDLFEISNAWAIYGGMGAVALWNIDWPNLKNKGIYNSLATQRGIDYLDEFVVDLIGLEWDTEEEKALRLFIFRAADLAKTYFSNNIEKKTDNEVNNLFLESMRAMFQVGVAVEMKRLGLN